MIAAATILSALVYGCCVWFLRSAMDSAPEAYEDERGFHFIR